MMRRRNGNLLMVANYPSDTSYAWWLMEHFWKNLAMQFESAGRKSFLAYPKITKLSDAISIDAIQTVELSLPWSSLTDAWKALKFIRENNIDSLYFTDQKYFSFIYLLLRLGGVRNIIVHDHTPGDRPGIGGLKGFAKSVLNHLPWCTANMMICVSEHMQRRNIKTTKVPPHKCTTVQNGIPPLNCNDSDKTTTRNQLGVSENCTLVVTTGRANPYKRFDFIIKSAGALKQQLPESDIVFLLVGDGPAMSDLKQQVQELGLEENVLLLGFRTDVRDILCASDIAFHAALGEGFSLSIIEYMSAGLPVLVPDIPSVSQAIAHNKTGLVYEKDDPKTAAEYIARLAVNQEQRLEIGKTARIEANRKYTLDHCTHSFIAAMKKAYHLSA